MPSGRENNISTYILFVALYISSIAVISVGLVKFSMPFYLALPLCATGFAHFMVVRQRDKSIRYLIQGRDLVLEGAGGEKLILKPDQIVSFIQEGEGKTGNLPVNKKTYMPFSTRKFCYLIYKNRGKKTAVKLLPDQEIRGFIQGILSKR
ncbi:MAG: hypothetical protein ACYC21_02260 [Eubacteriales bacterium]